MTPFRFTIHSTDAERTIRRLWPELRRPSFEFPSLDEADCTALCYYVNADWHDDLLGLVRNAPEVVSASAIRLT